MKKNRQLVTALVKKLNAVLKKSRGSLSNENAKHIKGAIKDLKRLEQLTQPEAKSKLQVIIAHLLQVLLRPEIMERIYHLIKEMWDKI